MDEDYDIIALGTGLKECILSGLASSVGKQKVLHMDRNPYYGGESASLNLEQLYKRFRGDEAPPPTLGRKNDYCVDLCPKLIMACGDFVKILLVAKVTAYLEFQSVSGSYVAKGGKIHKVPATMGDAAKSGLMGMFQKRRFKQFLDYVGNYEHDDKATHKGLDVTKMTTRELYTYWKLEESTMTFTSNAICLYMDETHMSGPALDTIERAKLYAYSLSRYGSSPYIYPKYGLGGLPEGFSRRCAVHGGTYMLNIDEKDNFIEKILFDDDGRVCGVQSEGAKATCKKLIADPSYFIGTDKIKKIGEIARCICILSHPIPNTNNADSCQLILPADSLPGKKSNVFVCMASFEHKIASQGKYIAVMSTIVDTANPKQELSEAIRLLGDIDETFFWVSDVYEPCNDPEKDGCYITSSYDSTTHFRTVSEEVLTLYKDLTGEAIDINISAEPDDLEP